MEALRMRKQKKTAGRGHRLIDWHTHLAGEKAREALRMRKPKNQRVGAHRLIGSHIWPGKIAATHTHVGEKEMEALRMRKQKKTSGKGPID
jgi:hypothetical protein